MISNYTQPKGFSLVETLVAISILLLVVTGPMTISIRTAKSASFASEQVQAYFLAQEGLELSQKARDEMVIRNFYDPSHPSYYHSSQPWTDFTSNSGVYSFCYGASGCGLNWGVVTPYNFANPHLSALLRPVNCGASTNACRLYLNSTGYPFFTYGSGAIETKFTRRIYFTDIGGGGVEVRSVVTWRTGSLVAEQSVSTVTYLYNIYDLP